MAESKQQQTLAIQIRKQISNRVFTCIFVVLAGIILLTIFDVGNSILQLKKKMADYCQPLEDFVISQVLVPGEDAIQVKLDEFNHEHQFMKLQWLKHKDNMLNEAKINWDFPFSWAYYYPLRTINDTQFGYFKITGSLLQNGELISNLSVRILLLLIFYFLVLGILYPLSNTIPEHMFIRPINKLLDLLNQDKKEKILDCKKDTENDLSEISQIKEKIMNLLLHAESRSREEALIALAAQVAHDIRSPLAALGMITSTLNEVSEDKRRLIRSIAARINDIANNLLTQHKKSPSIKEQDLARMKPELIYGALESIVSEKRAQFAISTVILDLHAADDVITAFSHVELTEFRRVLSNIINNAVESLGEKKHVNLFLQKENGMVIIKIQDEGCGIPGNILPKIFDGISYGKKEGHGLGLKHAYHTIKSWNGDVKIISGLKLGTTISIFLPETTPPSWFLSKIAIDAETHLVVFDDDPSIHEIWQRKFQALEVPNKTLTIMNFYCPEQLKAWYYQGKDILNSALFLMDYEIANSKITGLDLIEELGIQKQAILVTSRHEDTKILERCEQGGIRLLPKIIAAFY